MKSGYELYNTDIISKSENKRICCYFVVSDLHKIAPADIRIKTDELIEEINRHENWILESVVWDANHKVDTNRDGLNIILEKAKKECAGVLLVSAELEEIISLSDRIIVIHEGKITGEMMASEANENNLGLLMMGGKESE